MTAVFSPHGATSCGVSENYFNSAGILGLRLCPAGSRGNHVAPLSLSFWHVEGNCAESDAGMKAEALILFFQWLRIWGTLDFHR